MKASNSYSILVKDKEIEVVNRQGKMWVSVRHVCEALGIDFSWQRQKILSNELFSCGDIPTTGSDGKRYEMFCIQSDQAHLWVAGISAQKIKDPEKKKAFIEYQKECCSVLYHHFTGKGEDTIGISQAILQKLREEVDGLREDIRRVNDKIGVVGSDVREVRYLTMGTQNALNRIHPSVGYRVYEDSPIPPQEIDLLKEGTEADKRLLKKKKGEVPTRYLRILKPIN
jgi:hypothetical protein